MTDHINCIIVDDEPVARSIIRNYCGHLPFLQVIGEFGNALDAKAFLTDNKTDLLFLDIHMPVLNGVSFLNTLKNAPKVIFTTAYQEYAVNAFELDACDYLLKPFSLERFIVAVDKVREKLNAKPGVKNTDPTNGFFVKSDGKIFNVPYNDCLYAEAQGNYTKVVTINSILLTKAPFSAFVQQLPSGAFIKIHRSFIINKQHISHIEGNRLFIREMEIPIAGNYKGALLKMIGFDKEPDR